MKLMQVSLCALALAIALPLAAQDKPPQMTAEQQAMMQAWEKAAAPGEPHKQLATMQGKWNVKQTMWMDPKSEPMVQTGSATNKIELGGRHLRQDYHGQWMGKPFEGIGYTGYDNVTGKYFSTWSDNMSTGLFVAQGDYDPASKSYGYRAQMPDPVKPGTMVPVRETMRFTDKDHAVFEMYETRDGKELKTMQIEYTRTK